MTVKPKDNPKAYLEQQNIKAVKGHKGFVSIVQKNKLENLSKSTQKDTKSFLEQLAKISTNSAKNCLEYLEILKNAVESGETTKDTFEQLYKVVKAKLDYYTKREEIKEIKRLETLLKQYE